MRDAALLETVRRRSGGRKTRSSRRAFFVNGASLVRGNALWHRIGALFWFLRQVAAPPVPLLRQIGRRLRQRENGRTVWGNGEWRWEAGDVRGAALGDGALGGEGEGGTACGAMGLAGFVLL